MRLTEEQRRAVIWSLEKWDGILSGKYTLGMINKWCSLCRDAQRNRPEHAHGKNMREAICQYCILQKAGHGCLEDGSMFSWLTCLIEDDFSHGTISTLRGDHAREVTELCQKIRNNIESLLDDEKEALKDEKNKD